MKIDPMLPILIILIIIIVYLYIKVTRLNAQLNIIFLALKHQVNKNIRHEQTQETYEYVATNTTIEPKQNIKNT